MNQSSDNNLAVRGGSVKKKMRGRRLDVYSWVNRVESVLGHNRF